MLGKRKNSYIYNFDKVNESDIELIGIKGMNIARFYNEPINHPVTVIINSIAFDDFLVASNIAGPIMSVLQNVRPYDRNSAADASGQIANLILTSRIPDVVANSILEGYHMILNAARSPYVELGISEIISPEHQVERAYKFKDIEIVDENHLIEQTKYAWLSLFSTEAIEKRANTHYKGALSIALYLKSIIRAELTGKLFSIPPITNEEDLIEIWAMYGVNQGVDLESMADMYKVSINDLSIIQKNIVPQEYMNVRKGKPVKGEFPILTVNISKEWQRRQKLSDQQILQIAEIGMYLEKKLAKPIELTWTSEGGDLYVVEVDDILIVSDNDIPSTETQSEFLNQLKVNVYRTENESDKKLPDPDLDKLKEEIEMLVDKGNVNIETDIDDDFRLVSAKSKRRISEYPNWMKDYDLKTDIYLDVSKLDMVSLNSLDLFDGSYFDGTDLILSNNVLPETYFNNKTKVMSTLERFASEIAMASKNSEGEPLLYSFSNIGEYEYQLLGYDRKDFGYMGDERFLEFPEAMAIEIQSIKKAKEDYNRKKISVVFPYIRTIRNLEDLKSVVSAHGLRRSKLTKFYAEVAIPSFVYELESIPEGLVDGFVINYDELLKMMVYRQTVRKIDHEVVIRLIKKIVKICQDMGYEYIFKVDEQYTEVIKEMILMSPSKIIFKNIPSESMIKQMMEVELLTKRSSVSKVNAFLHTKI